MSNSSEHAAFIRKSRPVGHRLGSVVGLSRKSDARTIELKVHSGKEVIEFRSETFVKKARVHSTTSGRNSRRLPIYQSAYFSSKPTAVYDNGIVVSGVIFGPLDGTWCVANYVRSGFVLFAREFTFGSSVLARRVYGTDARTTKSKRGRVGSPRALALKSTTRVPSVRNNGPTIINRFPARRCLTPFLCTDRRGVGDSNSDRRPERFVRERVRTFCRCIRIDVVVLSEANVMRLRFFGTREYRKP